MVWTNRARFTSLDCCSIRMALGDHLFALVVASAAAVCCTACVAQEPAPAVGVAQAATAAALAADDADFPLPIWKNRVFDDANNLAGVLLQTAQGPVQIKELKWGANQQGFINICYVDGYSTEGEPVTFGAPEGCLEQVSKENFLGYAMTQSDVFIQSFDFATDHEGYLFVGNPVTSAGPPSEEEEDCGIRHTRRCESAGCNAACGFTAIALVPIPTGSGPAINPDTESFLQVDEPIQCTCSGTEGGCQVQNIQTCSGTCLPGLSCEAKLSGGEFGCECR